MCKHLVSNLTCITDSYMTGLELEASDWSEVVAMEASKAKKQKLENQLKFPVRVAILKLLHSVVGGGGVQPTSVGLLPLLKEKATMDYLIEVGF